MDGSNWVAQGRSKSYADDRIARKLKSKGCLKNAKNEVLRISVHGTGRKIYRCPKAVSDDLNVVSHFNDYINSRSGGSYLRAEDFPYKWHKVRSLVRNEVAKVEKSKRQEEERRQASRRPKPARRS